MYLKALELASNQGYWLVNDTKRSTTESAYATWQALFRYTDATLVGPPAPENLFDYDRQEWAMGYHAEELGSDIIVPTHRPALAAFGLRAGSTARPSRCYSRRMYAIRNAEGQFVGRAHSKVGAHRATRRANRAGSHAGPMTIQIHTGEDVLAKIYKGGPTALHYSNRTQAYKKAAAMSEIHPGHWIVIERRRGHWYVKHVPVSLDHGAASNMAGGSSSPLRCDMTADCTEPITHLDSKGYLYCTKHAAQRKSSSGPSVRKLKPGEISKLSRGESIRGYNQA